MGASLERQLNGTSGEMTRSELAKVHRQVLYEYPFLDCVAESMLVTDLRQKDSPIVFSNDSFERMTLYDKSEIIGRNCRFLQGEDTNRDTVRRIRAAIDKGECIDVELLNYRKDGVPFYNCFLLLPIHKTGKKTGKVTHYIAIQKDITVLKQAGSDPRLWTPAEVAMWLRHADFERFVAAFIAANVDGKRLFALAELDMESLGLTLPSERQQLALAIAVIRDTPEAAFDLKELVDKDPYMPTAQYSPGRIHFGNEVNLEKRAFWRTAVIGERVPDSMQTVKLTCAGEPTQVILVPRNVTYKQLSRLIEKQLQCKAKICVQNAEGDALPLKNDETLESALSMALGGTMHIICKKKRVSLSAERVSEPRRASFDVIVSPRADSTPDKVNSPSNHSTPRAADGQRDFLPRAPSVAQAKVARSVSVVPAGRPAPCLPEPVSIVATSLKAQGDDCQRQLEASGHKVLFTDLEIQVPPIGRGAFGVVYRARFNGTDVAVKTFIDDSDEATANFALECVNMSRLHHSNVVQFIGSSFDTLSIVSEYCHNGSLYDLYKKKPELLTEETLYRIWYGSIAGFTYLHSRNIIHRDVKAGNILLTQYLEAKVADFGISRTVDERAMTKQVGTLRWTAPEVLAGSKYGVAADVYSFAIVMHETYSRQIPYEHIHFNSQVDDFVQGGGRPDLAQIQTHISPQFLMIMQECWHQDPRKRPTFSELLKRLHAETGAPKAYASGDALVPSASPVIGLASSASPTTTSSSSSVASKKDSGSRDKERERSGDKDRDENEVRGSKKEKKHSASSRHSKSSRKLLKQRRITLGGMSTDDICAQLATLSLSKYEDAFRRENITGAVLLEFTEADFKELGVSLGDRKMLLKWLDL